MGFRKMPPVWAFFFKDRFFVGRYRMSVAEMVFMAEMGLVACFGIYQLYRKYGHLYMSE